MGENNNLELTMASSPIERSRLPASQASGITTDYSAQVSSIMLVKAASSFPRKVCLPGEIMDMITKEVFKDPLLSTHSLRSAHSFLSAHSLLSALHPIEGRYNYARKLWREHSRVVVSRETALDFRKDYKLSTLSKVTNLVIRGSWDSMFLGEPITSRNALTSIYFDHYNNDEALEELLTNSFFFNKGTLPNFQGHWLCWLMNASICGVHEVRIRVRVDKTGMLYRPPWCSRNLEHFKTLIGEINWYLETEGVKVEEEANGVQVWLWSRWDGRGLLFVE